MHMGMPASVLDALGGRVSLSGVESDVSVKGVSVPRCRVPSCGTRCMEIVRKYRVRRFALLIIMDSWGWMDARWSSVAPVKVASWFSC